MIDNKFIYLILILLLLLSPETYSQSNTNSNITEIQIQQSVNSMKNGGTITLPNEVIRINTPLLVTNSNVRIVGDTNTILKLDDNSNCPIIVIGIQGGDVITNSELISLQLDGNRTNQCREIWKLSDIGYPIYNNGIVIQNARDIFLYDIITSNCRSGGLVSTLNVNKLVVVNYVSFNNQFDGISCYQTSNSYFINLYLHDNIAAGISVDMGFNYNIFKNIIILE